METKKNNYETSLVTMGAKIKEAGWGLTTSGKNGKNFHINKTQFELNIVKFIFPYLMINILNTHASKNFKADYQVKNRKQI